jgi:hypothetical protein
VSTTYYQILQMEIVVTKIKEKSKSILALMPPDILGSSDTLYLVWIAQIIIMPIIIGISAWREAEQRAAASR